MLTCVEVDDAEEADDEVVGAAGEGSCPEAAAMEIAPEEGSVAVVTDEGPLFV